MRLLLAPHGGIAPHVLRSMLMLMMVLSSHGYNQNRGSARLADLLDLVLLALNDLRQ